MMENNGIFQTSIASTTTIHPLSRAGLMPGAPDIARNFCPYTAEIQ